ncbi:MAG: hypothetical protein JO040_05705 [Gemmatimonadetes bacterium]|nr:hypothetical protein [Gemmatimonadota bacterium]
MHRRTRAPFFPLPLAAALALAAAPCRAQEPAADAGCPGGRISTIFVDNHAVFDPTDTRLDPRFSWAYHFANRLHVPTREAVIRREILFTEGSCYSPDVLLDSERLLRATTFISNADIYGIRQPDGTYHVIVDTDDEWSTRIEPQVNSQGAGLELREANLAGTGQQVNAYYGHQLGEQVYGASYGTPQLLGTQLDAELSAGRTPNGYALTEELSYPFRGENGRWALRQRFEHEDRYFEYMVQDRGPEEASGRMVRLLFPERRRSADVGGVFRLGRRGNLTLFGVALAGEWIRYPGISRFASARDSAHGPPLLTPEQAGFDSVANVRAVFLAGQRSVYFVRRTALDAVRGTEDVRLGVEAEVGIGRSLERLSTDNDLALDLGLFLAGELPGGMLSGGRVTVEGKRDYGAPVGNWEWRNVFAQLDAWTYWRRSQESRHTVVASLAAAGGWRTTVPFQLTLGSLAGLRGYPRDAVTGARRAVLSLEDRYYLGWPYPQLFDLGSTAFIDVGRSWAGGDIFANGAPYRASVGVGLRAAFPPGSRRTYRLDVAAPLAGRVGLRSVVVSVGIGQAIGRDVRDDPQIRRSSRRSLSASLFDYPS